MKQCKHEYLRYQGTQETTDKDETLYLCICATCFSTISIPIKFILDISGNVFKNIYKA